MAVTAIWDIKGRIDRVIGYVMNPQKTQMDLLHSVEDVLNYATDDSKTEQMQYVTGINCEAENAVTEFRFTKMQWEKCDGIVAFHAYQSFRPGEVDPETAHKIGVALARELWGDRFEVVVATHLNTEHCHNHIVINSVSFKDGMRYNDCKESYRKLREASDRLCKEYQLSVIRNPSSKGKHYAQWSAEKNGKPTYRSLTCQDIERAILLRRGTTNEQLFKEYARELSMAYLDSGENFSRKDGSFIAMCSAYVLCRRYGLDTADFNFRTVPDQCGEMDSKAMRHELKKIRDCANRIYGDMSHHLERLQVPQTQGVR